MLIRPRLALTEPRRARVEIIPLIDVVFFLMAAFVLFAFTMSNTRALALTLPQGGKGPDSETVVLQISESGTAFWNQERMKVSELPARLRAYQKATADSRVLVTGDETTQWGPLIAAVDEVRQAGIRTYSIETHTRPTGK